MIGLIIGIVIGAVAVYFIGKKLTLAQVKAELVKLEGEAKAEEQAIVAKIKAALKL